LADPEYLIGNYPVVAPVPSTMLESISQPSDIQNLTADQLDALCEEIRAFILE